ncbi:DUF1501 domain-containing protein [Rhodopirellula sp. SWK7]|uniref:DUF1501 domain-containing protein n=1 Tax=Rhodopirellula sp. SWK7 TaxID=595460 RepID=UPI0005C6360B|nr:DUF1501 domain-containing protein [Rhodopirellula sp. SWK7]
MKRLTIEQELVRARIEQDTRRQFLQRCTTGLGGMWLASQAGGAAASSAESHSALPHFPAKAKRVIFLHMIGGPSQLELFDYKPELAKYDGRDAPQEYLDGQRFAFIQGTPQMLGPQFSFKQYGESGAWVSELFPHVAGHVDKMCFIKTMQTDQFNHGPAQLLVHTGNARIGYPSEGAWVTWGLGTENEDLPGFMVLLSGGVPRNGKALWSNGYLPSVYQGVQCRSQGDPILNISNPANVTRDIRRQMLDALGDLNRKSHEQFHDPETLTRIAQYEMSFRMQMAVPDVADISNEPQQILDMYGAKKGEVSFANNCLLARRFAEAGVRFIQLYDGGWDSHGTEAKTAINDGFAKKCKEVDQPIAALLADLDQRGLLEDTLVVWGGEFGRTPMRENRGGNKMALIGRDHAPAAFTFFMAGGGAKPGFTYGETDEFGYLPASNPVQVRDFHATMLHLLGIESDRMSYYFQGLNQKLTGVKPARVIHDVIA